MPSFVTVTSGATAQAQDVNQLILAMNGTAGSGIPISLTAVNDSVNFALAVKNADPTNSRSLQVLKANNNVLIQADANGVIVSPDGGATTGQVLTVNATQTLTNKTFSGNPDITLASAASRIVPGATSLSLRNAANTADNVLITDAGIVTFRGLPVNLPAQTGGVTKAIAWGDGGAGLTSILGNTAGGSPATCVLRFDVANGNAAGSITALTLDGNGKVSTGAGGLNAAGGVAMGGGATATMGTIGGSGPATATMNRWLKMQVDGSTCFAPVWV